MYANYSFNKQVGIFVRSASPDAKSSHMRPGRSHRCGRAVALAVALFWRLFQNLYSEGRLGCGRQASPFSQRKRPAGKSGSATAIRAGRNDNGRATASTMPASTPRSAPRRYKAAGRFSAPRQPQRPAVEHEHHHHRRAEIIGECRPPCRGRTRSPSQPVPMGT